LCALAVSVTVSVSAAPQSPTQAAPIGNAETGKRLYEKQTCFFCHGTAGQGGNDGARIAVVARNLQSFTRYVRQPSGRMPAFTDKILSDQDVADIFAYVRSLPQAKAVKDIPLLEQLKK
jgi:mono/diheme cytochrome c family protein